MCPDENSYSSYEDDCNRNCVSPLQDTGFHCEDICDLCWNHSDCLSQGLTSTQDCYDRRCSDEGSYSFYEDSSYGEDDCNRNCVSPLQDAGFYCEDICDLCWNHSDCLSQGLTSTQDCYDRRCSDEGSSHEESSDGEHDCNRNCLSPLEEAGASCENICDSCWDHPDCLVFGFSDQNCYDVMCSDENSSNEVVERMDVVLDGNYESVVGSEKKKFLEECSATLVSVCVAVRPESGRITRCPTCNQSSSIVVTLEGTSQEVNADEADVKENGLTLDSFGTLSHVDSDVEKGGRDEDSGTDSAFSILTIVVIVTLL